MNLETALPWTAALLLIAIQWAPVPGSAFVTTAAIRVPAVRSYLPNRALTIIELADYLTMAIRLVRLVRKLFG